MRIRYVATLLATIVLVAGCSGSDNGPTDPTSGNGSGSISSTPGVGSFKALFQYTVVSPTTTIAVFPYPTDLYFSGSTDGTLNIPTALQQVIPNLVGLNKLDGYSTTAPMSARFSKAINPATIGPQTVIVLEVNIDNATKATVGVRRPLVYGTDFTARVAPTVDSAGSTLEILPLKPLTPSTGATNVGYLVILTNGLRDTTGNAATPDDFYQQIKAALPTCAAFTNANQKGICLLTGAHLTIAGAINVPPANVVLTFSFSTQSTADTLNILSAFAQPAPISAEPLGLTVSEATGGFVPGPNSSLFAGEITLPYYLAPPSAANPAAPLAVNWRSATASPIDPTGTSFELTRFNPVPNKLVDVTVPLLIGVPNDTSPWCGAPPCAKPAAGWPVVVFFPGFTRTRTDMLPIAGAYANAGFVVVAMDHPLHGMPAPEDAAGSDNPLVQFPLTDLIYVPWDPVNNRGERTFGVDYVDNATRLPPSDGVPDYAGQVTLLLLLQNPIVFRDLARQATIDFVVLAKSLAALDLDGDDVGDVDTSRLHLAGHSGGAILGGVAAALDVPFRSAYLNAATGQYVYSLFHSTAYGPILGGALASRGALPGTTPYENFIRDVQTIADPSDPLNYIATAVAARPVLLSIIENDTNVTNENSMLLVTAANLEKASTAGPNLVAAGAGRYLFFLEGGHGSLLGEPAGLTTVEMQTNAATLAALGGGAFLIQHPELLEQ